MREIILPLLAVFMLSGCGIKRPIPEAELPEIDKIAVVSLLGDNIHLSKIGLIIFQNEFALDNVNDWEIDEYMENKIIETLEKETDYQPIKLPPLPAIYRNLNSAGEWDTDPEIIYDKILKSAIEKDVSYVLLALPSGYDNAPFFRAGYGLFERAGFITCPYALFILGVYKINAQREWEVLGWEWGFDSTPCATKAFGDGLFGLEPSSIPIEWNATIDAYARCEKDWIKNGIKHGIDNGVKYALKKLKLVSAKGHHEYSDYEAPLYCDTGETKIRRSLSKDAVDK